MSLPPGLLSIARQLHGALSDEIGHEIEIERLVSDGRYARDVLLVCEACDNPSLHRLADEFRALVAPPARLAADEPAVSLVSVPGSMLERAMLAATTAVDSAGLASPAPGAAAAAGPTGPAAPPAWLADRPSDRPSGRHAATARPANWLQRLTAGWRRR